MYFNYWTNDNYQISCFLHQQQPKLIFESFTVDNEVKFCTKLHSHKCSMFIQIYILDLLWNVQQHMLFASIPDHNMTCSYLIYFSFCPQVCGGNIFQNSHLLLFYIMLEKDWWKVNNHCLPVYQTLICRTISFLFPPAT